MRTHAVMSKLMGLKEDKSPGLDNIHFALLRNCARTVALLTIIYQKSFSEDTLLDDSMTGKQQQSFQYSRRVINMMLVTTDRSP